MISKKEKKEITCKKCKYKWETKSEMYSVSCPRCGSKVVLKKSDDGTRKNGETNTPVEVHNA